MSVPSDEEFIFAATKYYYFTGLGSSSNTINNVEKNTLEKRIQDIKDKQKLAEIEEETHNEIYFNSKKNPATFALFSKIGLQTTQDWVLAYFFFSYIVMSILIVFTSLTTSVNKILTFVSVSAVLFILGVVFFIMIVSFA
jgi:hypothetical protein